MWIFQFIHSFKRTPLKKRVKKKYKLGFKLMKGALKIIRPKRQKKKFKNPMKKLTVREGVDLHSLLFFEH